MHIFHGKLIWRRPWASHGIALGALAWVDAMHICHGKLIWRTPWASHGIALGLLHGWVPCISAMASSSGEPHGHPMELHWGSCMGGCHAYLPWQAHLENTMGIPWNCIGALAWVDAMHIFHGKLIWRTPWASHGIALGILHGWVPSISSMASSSGEHHGHPMELHWSSCMGGCHPYLPWQAHLENTMGIPWNCLGALAWVDAMDIF